MRVPLGAVVAPRVLLNEWGEPVGCVERCPHDPTVVQRELWTAVHLAVVEAMENHCAIAVDAVDDAAAARFHDELSEVVAVGEVAGEGTVVFVCRDDRCCPVPLGPLGRYFREQINSLN